MTERPAPPIGAREQRAAWVWRFTTPGDVVAFALSHGLAELFVAVPEHVDIHADRALLVDLATQARAHGIGVAALGGDPAWVDDATGVVERWLRPVIALDVFDGVHLDVEPSFVVGPSRPAPADGYLRLVDLFAASLPGDLALEVDVGFWYHEIPVGGTVLTAAVLTLVDAVTVMSYRDTTAGVDGSIALSRPTAERAAMAGRRFRVGQDTTDRGPLPHQRKQTFFGHPRSDLETAMIDLDLAFGPTAGYAGTAVHDWRGYADLAPGAG